MNKKLLIFGNSSYLYVCFVKMLMKQYSIFYECNITMEFWKSLIFFFEKCSNLLYLTPQTGPFRFTDTYCNDILFKTHIILLFKIHLYKSREQEISLYDLIKNATEVKNIEKKFVKNNKKIMLYKKVENNWKTSSLINLSKR